jgi:hypothetical protein
MGHTRAGVGLPAPAQAYEGPLAFDVRDLAEPLPPIRAERPPSGAPNVLMVLLAPVERGRGAWKPYARERVSGDERHPVTDR